MSITYQLKRSKRATRARIVVTAEHVAVVAPLRMLQRDIAEFVDSKQLWIKATMQQLQARLGSIKPLGPSQLIDGALMPFQGQHFPISLQETHLKRVKIEFEQGFKIAVPSSLAPLERDAAIRRALITWFKQATMQQVLAFINQHTHRYNLVPGTIRIKLLKSRWGSCAANNDININWLLILAPPEILEYVVVHELCHVQIRNHSKDFWALVAKHLPAFKQHRNWLKANGASLMRGI